MPRSAAGSLSRVTCFEHAVAARGHARGRRHSRPEPPALDADLLARHALGWDRRAWLARPRRAAPMPDSLTATTRSIARRLDARAGGLDPRRARSSRVASSSSRRDVLIPRPETEILIETARALLPRSVQPRAPWWTSAPAAAASPSRWPSRIPRSRYRRDRHLRVTRWPSRAAERRAARRCPRIAFPSGAVSRGRARSDRSHRQQSAVCRGQRSRGAGARSARATNRPSRSSAAKRPARHARDPARIARCPAAMTGSLMIEIGYGQPSTVAAAAETDNLD